MRSMKKLFALLTACLLAAAAFAGCPTQPDADVQEPTAAPDAAATEAPADDSTEAPADDPAAADSDLAYIQEKGNMIIGYTVYEPMNYTDENGEFTGFDTELATLVCEKLGVEPVIQEIDWNTKEVELNGKTIDCIWNGMTQDADRAASMACTKPYVKNAQVVVMKADAEYTDTSSLIGKTVVAEMGSAGETTIQGDENLAQAR